MIKTVIPAWVDGVLTPVEKLLVHQKGLKHKAISVFVMNKGRVLLQQRAMCKYHTPGLWANTCCTHPNWNEDSSDAGDAPDNQNACVSQACSSGDMADWDIEMLTWQAANTMPAGRIVITPCTMTGAVSSCVIVAWNDQAPADCLDENDGVASGEETECVVMEVTR